MMAVEMFIRIPLTCIAIIALIGASQKLSKREILSKVKKEALYIIIPSQLVKDLRNLTKKLFIYLGNFFQYGLASLGLPMVLGLKLHGALVLNMCTLPFLNSYLSWYCV